MVNAGQTVRLSWQVDKMIETFGWTKENQVIPESIQDWMDEEKEKFCEEVYFALIGMYE